VIITDAEMNGKDAYMQAVDELAKLRNPVMIINLNDQSLDDVFSGLKVYHPKYVAIVVHPETIESNFVGQVFEGLTKLDDDPLLDCAFGYITGMTSSDALRMVQSTAQSESTRNVSNKLVVIAHTFAQNDLYPFAKQNARRYQSYGFNVETINPIDNSPEWRQKADNEIKKLSNATLIFLAGHGMGDMSCNIAGDKLGEIQLESAVIVNGTCHSGVTFIRHDSTDRHWTIATTKIDMNKSVCLNFIKAGAIGQFASTASSSWMNVGFSITHFFNNNRSLGEAHQISINNKIRSAGIKKINIRTFNDGERSPQALGNKYNPGGIQSISRVILIGDPAYQPFPHRLPLSNTDSTNKISQRLRNGPPELLELIDKLSDSSEPRFKALNDIIKIGKDAVPTLIHEMKNNNNWQIPKALGAIGDKRAIEPLIKKLKNEQWSPMRDVVSESLQIITAKNFGTDWKRWSDWWKSEKTN
jgi:hypothetical protein